MKKTILILILSCITNVSFGQTGKDPKIVDEVLQIQYVEQYEGKTALEILNSVVNFINDWNSTIPSNDIFSDKRKIEIEYNNMDEFILSANGKLLLGKKTGFGSIYTLHANFSVNVKAKDNRALITIIVPSLYYYLRTAAGNLAHDYPINECYPNVITKKEMYHDKKILTEFGQNTPKIMSDFARELTSKSVKIEDIDF